MHHTEVLLGVNEITNVILKLVQGKNKCLMDVCYDYFLQTLLNSENAGGIQRFHLMSPFQSIRQNCIAYCAGRNGRATIRAEHGQRSVSLVILDQGQQYYPLNKV